MLIESLNRSKEIESSIRKIEPNFVSNNQGTNATVLRLLEQNRRR